MTHLHLVVEGTEGDRGRSFVSFLEKETKDRPLSPSVPCLLSSPSNFPIKSHFTIFCTHTRFFTRTNPIKHLIQSATCTHTKIHATPMEV